MVWENSNSNTAELMPLRAGSNMQSHFDLNNEEGGVERTVIITHRVLYLCDQGNFIQEKSSQEILKGYMYVCSNHSIACGLVHI